MALGLPYDSDEGRSVAAAITSLMTGHAYRTSARMADRMGPFEGFEHNREPMLNVLEMHREAAELLDDAVAPELVIASRTAWFEACALAQRVGVRNSQATVLAPTGTIGLLMDCDTTGIEPDLSLVKHKRLVGGGTMSIVNRTVPRALRRLGYDDVATAAVLAWIDEHQTVIGCPDISDEHMAVFIDPCQDGRRSNVVVAEAPQGPGHGPVDDRHGAAADQALVLDQAQVRLDASRVAVHKQADGAGGRQHGGLAVPHAHPLRQRASLEPRCTTRDDQLRCHSVVE
jgi:ribonucleoside-diphosphate reductase alpha chain